MTANTSDLASHFAEQQTYEIMWDGPLFSLYELSSDTTELIIRFVHAKPRPPRGLRLKIRGGSFDIEGTTARDLVLWHDTAPT